MTSSELLLDNYRNAVETLFALKSGQLISNSSIEHAAVITEMIFKYAPDNAPVYVLCKNLHKDCFGNKRVLAEAKNAILRGVKIHIAYTDTTEAEELTALSENNVKVKKVAPLIVGEKKTELNFITNGQAIRIEADASVHEAEVIPNAPAVAKGLADLFNLLQEKKGA
jgi:hypothetical protein